MNTIKNTIPWLDAAKRDLGLKEITGSKHEPVIVSWLLALKAWWTDDETPWCGVAMAWWMKSSKLPYPKLYMRAKSWSTWGVEVPKDKPFLGCVGIWNRQGGGHVGIIVGINENGHHMVLGGNQGNKVSIVAISPDRLESVRWPLDFPVGRIVLPAYYTNSKAVSTNEA
jgi:uncharacterized protein (TIGR02594 family)